MAGMQIRELIAIIVFVSTLTNCLLLYDPEAVPEKYQHLHTSYVENGGKVPFGMV